MKTFTYEIPNDTQVPTNQNFSFKNEFYNSSNTSTTSPAYPDRDIPPPDKYLTAPPPGPAETYLYKKETHNTVNRTNEFPPTGVSPPTTLGPNQTYFYKREVNETKNNVYGPPQPPPVTNSTMIYEHNETNTTNRNVHGPPQQPPPVTNSTMIYETNTTNTTNRNVHHPPGGFPVYPSSDTPPPVGPKQTYLYKKETSNTTNTTYGPDGEYPPRAPSPISPASPVEPSRTYYKYASEKTTTNTSTREPALRPFPTDNLEPFRGDQQPPKHLNQLLATLDDVSEAQQPARSPLTTAFSP